MSDKISDERLDGRLDDPSKLELLANWHDLNDTRMGAEDQFEVQNDLRRIAKQLRAERKRDMTQDDDKTITIGELHLSVISCCSCGGNGPEEPEACPACRIWHDLKGDYAV